MKKLAISSGNPEKIYLIQQAAEQFGIDIVETKHIIVNEDQDSYLGNATKKAMAQFRLSSIPSIADDFGMEIYGLKMQPGIQTRRWGNESELNDEQLLYYTIKKISHLDENERMCDFTGVGVIVYEINKSIQKLEKDSGILLLEPRGELIKGHPLASILYLPEHRKTLAELKSDPTFKAKDLRIYSYLLEQFHLLIYPK